jgi:hypothetical protein
VQGQTSQVDSSRLGAAGDGSEEQHLLKDDDLAALGLEEGKTHQDIQAMIDGEKMKATRTIEEVLTANSMTKRNGRAPKSGQIHMLAVVSKPVGEDGA